MAHRLIECVANFSDGRDHTAVEAIASAIRSVPGAALLDRHMDSDHNRSVLTFVGEPDAVGEAALRAVAKSVELIDLNRHRGVHPRIGSADVVPFVPLKGVTIAECVALALRTGDRLWRELGVPVYLYGAAARHEDRVRLENVRRGQFESLRERVLVDPDRAPDIGGPALHPTAGASAVGVRKLLIAFNVNLGTADVEIARRIAGAVRESSGGLRHVKAMGVLLASRSLAQVSMNLTDFEETPLHVVFEAVRSEAERQGVPVVESEIVGLVPRKALEMAAEFYLRSASPVSPCVIENRIEDLLG